jgi:hypothetical protein
LPQYRSRLLIKRSVPEPGKPYDPGADAFVLALNDWSKPHPGAKTLVWDHMTATASDILSAIADKGQFSDKHIAIGAPGASKMNIPMEGDYGAAQGTIDRLTTYLFRQPLHLIILTHAMTAESKDGSGLVGGPALVGKAMVRNYAGRFDTVLRLGRRKVENREAFTCYTDRSPVASFWTAGIRSHLPVNPIPSIDLSPDPVNFWEAYDQHFLLAHETINS